MQRILVKYFNEEKSMAVKMKIQGDLQPCHTLQIALWRLRSFVTRMRISSRSDSQVEAERRNRFPEPLTERILVTALCP